MLFSGEGKQNISIPSPCGESLGHVTVTGAGITTDTGFSIDSLESDIKIEGDVKQLDIVNWNGHGVNVSGNLTIEGTSLGNGYIKTEGNLLVSRECLNVGAGRIEVGGDLTVYGSGLSMNDAAGYILVNGDVNISGTSYGGYSNFEKGTLELRGNLSKEDNGERGWYVRTA